MALEKLFVCAWAEWSESDLSKEGRDQAQAMGVLIVQNTLCELVTVLSSPDPQTSQTMFWIRRVLGTCNDNEYQCFRDDDTQAGDADACLSIMKEVNSLSLIVVTSPVFVTSLARRFAKEVFHADYTVPNLDKGQMFGLTKSRCVQLV